VADVRFHPGARAEYEEALAWYAARSPRAAARFEAEVERMLGLIESNPGMFPAYDDEHRFAVLRRFSYSLVYQTLADHIFVIAVAHSARQAGYWQGRS
jgi:plasmid stabilization system protein ParE